MHKKIMDFITNEVWRIQRKNLSQFNSYLITQLRIILLVGRRLREDKCQLRASALTYYTLLSVVPLCAMLFGIAKGFGYQKVLEQELYERFAEHKEAFTSLVQFANNLLEETQGSVLAGLGLVLLFWSVMKLLGHIESSINKTWGIKNARRWKRKLSDYLAMMLILPIFFVLSSRIDLALSESSA